jgi:hypothetical protein
VKELGGFMSRGYGGFSIEYSKGKRTLERIEREVNSLPEEEFLKNIENMIGGEIGKIYMGNMQMLDTMKLGKENIMRRILKQRLGRTWMQLGVQ